MHKKLLEEHPEIAVKITEDELYKILKVSFALIGELLGKGYRVIFEGYFSFFTKPIKRKCTNLYTKENWWTYKRRIRVKPMDSIKKIAENDISEEEYLKFKEEENITS